MHRATVLGSYLFSWVVLFAITTSADAAKYLKNDGSWVDPIQSVQGGVHPYSRNNLKPLANLSGAYLNDADLNDANLDHAWLSHAILTNANLTDSNLSGANLFANLAGANLTSADLTGADLNYANLTKANLTDANLDQVEMDGARLGGANLSGSFLTNTRGWDNDTTTWTGSFYYTDNEPIWDSGMTPTWRDSVGILAIDPPRVPEPATLLLSLFALALLPLWRRRR